MNAPLIPNNEVERLNELYSFKVLDSFEEKDYDYITHLASQICNTKYSLITLIDKDRQWFKSKCGIGINETHRDVSFCGHVIVENKDVYIVEDARKSLTFFDNPFVVENPNVVFYAGVPLRSENGFALGTLCVFHDDLIELSEEQLYSLKGLANQVMNLLNLRKTNLILSEQSKLLEAKNSNLEDFFKFFKDLIVVTDLKLNLINSNESWSKNFGKNELTNDEQNFLDFVFCEDKKVVDLQVDKALKMSISDNFVCKMKDNDFVFKEIIWRIYFLEDNYYFYGRDVTHQKNTESNLLKLLNLSKSQNERLQNFAHIVSHNLRSHSTNISSLVHLIGEKYPVKENEFFKMLLLASENMIETTNNLSDVALLYSSSKDEINKFKLKKLIKKSIDTFQLELNRNNISVDINVYESIEIYGFAEYLDSVFQNLISNAIKYSRESNYKFLRIVSHDEENYIKLSFEDNGLGIDLSRYKDKIFGMYKTFHYTENSRGLGLFITKNQMEAMGGWIEVESQVNIGSKFNLYFKKNND
jgi:signal transduction histidine kinase